MNDTNQIAPQLTPTQIGNTAYFGCLQWLEGELWQDILPRLTPLQSGGEAASILGANLNPKQRQAFIDGWESALEYWSKERDRKYQHRVFKAKCWGLSIALNFLFWSLLSGWWL